MPGFKSLSYQKLRNKCDPKFFKFKDTSEIEPLQGIIGQERAVKAMEFGLKINIRGYNIYMSGMTGTGKTSYAQNYIKRLAEKEKVPYLLIIGEQEIKRNAITFRSVEKPGKSESIRLEEFLEQIRQKCVCPTMLDNNYEEERLD